MQMSTRAIFFINNHFRCSCTHVPELPLTESGNPNEPVHYTHICHLGEGTSFMFFCLREFWAPLIDSVIGRRKRSDRESVDVENIRLNQFFNLFSRTPENDNLAGDGNESKLNYSSMYA